MRTLLALTLLVAAVAAQAQPEQSVVKDGKLEDKTWTLTFAARGLERGLSTQTPNAIFEGRAAGSVQIEILVFEQGKKLDGKGWRDWYKTTELKRQQRKPENVEESKDGLATLVFNEKKLDIFNEEHGYAFYPRGYQCFVVHAHVADKTDDSGKLIREYLGGLKLGEGSGATMNEIVIAARAGRPISDPLVTLLAGRMYAYGDQQRRGVNLELATTVLERARAAMKPETYNADQRYVLYSAGGYAHLAKKPDEGRDTKAAIQWLSKAEETAKEMPEQARAQAGAGAAYNLACAYSLDGNLDKAFETLDRAFSEVMPVDAAHLTNDKDLDNLKKDQARWDKFWKARVQGR